MVDLINKMWRKVVFKRAVTGIVVFFLVVGACAGSFWMGMNNKRCYEISESAAKYLEEGGDVKYQIYGKVKNIKGGNIFLEVGGGEFYWISLVNPTVTTKKRADIKTVGLIDLKVGDKVYAQGIALNDFTDNLITANGIMILKD